MRIYMENVNTDRECTIVRYADELEYVIAIFDNRDQHDPGNRWGYSVETQGMDGHGESVSANTGYDTEQEAMAAARAAVTTHHRRLRR